MVTASLSMSLKIQLSTPMRLLSSCDVCWCSKISNCFDYLGLGRMPLLIILCLKNFVGVFCSYILQHFVCTPGSYTGSRIFFYFASCASASVMKINLLSIIILSPWRPRNFS